MGLKWCFHNSTICIYIHVSGPSHALSKQGGGGGGGVAHSPFIRTLNIAYSLNKSLNMATVPTCVILHLPGYTRFCRLNVVN